MYTTITPSSSYYNNTKHIRKRITKLNGQLKPKKYIWTKDYICVDYVRSSKAVEKYKTPLYIDLTSGETFIVLFGYVYGVKVYELYSHQS